MDFFMGSKWFQCLQCLEISHLWGYYRFMGFTGNSTSIWFSTSFEQVPENSVWIGWTVLLIGIRITHDQKLKETNIDQSENARSLYSYDFNFIWLCVTINQPGLVSLLMHITSHNFPKPNTMKPRTADLFTAMHPTVGRMVDDTSGAYRHIAIAKKAECSSRLRPSTVWRKLHLATYIDEIWWIYDEYKIHMEFLNVAILPVTL